MKNLNLRSSSFINYAFGFYTPRREMLEWDLKGETKPIDNPFQIRAMKKGVRMEKVGIAKWCSLKNEIPNYILNDQQSFKQEDWLNLRKKETISLSTTPDGISQDSSTIIEVKTTKMGKKVFDDFPKQYLAQIYGQMWIVGNLTRGKVKRAHLVNISTEATKIWQIEWNQKFINYLIGLLEQYSLALLNEDPSMLEESKKDIEKYPGDLKKEKSIKLIHWEKYHEC